MKILLAEDDMNISMIAKITLEQIGKHTVTVVHDGESALREAMMQNFDVILLDEMMPKMNGLKVCTEYKSRTSTPSPVIFLSAKSQADVVDEFTRLGLGFIAKPFDPSTLCSEIEAIMKGKKSA